MTPALAPPPSPVEPAADPAARLAAERAPVERDEYGPVSARTGVRMTADEFLALPEAPDVTRWLINGEVWEEPMTVRSAPHTSCESRVARRLWDWLDERLPGGEVASGEAAVRIPSRETVVGVDVVVFDAETMSNQPPPPGKGEGMHVWHGVPRLAVEIMSPSDRVGDVDAKVEEYLADGVPLVWVANPGPKTVTVHRPDGPVRTYQGDDAVPGGEALPGLDVRAGDLFGR